MRAKIAWLALLFAATPISCGDPLTSAGYLGEPLFSFEGIIVSILNDLPEQHSVRVALGWSLGGTEPTHVNELVEQDSVSVQVRFPAAFEVNIFYPPPSEFLEQESNAYGLAYLVVYEDRDGDEHFDAEEILGGAPSQVLVYAARDLPAAQSPTKRPLPPGFHLIPVPAPCEPVQDFRTPVTCEVPVGSPCTSNADCQGGTCLDEIAGTEFPGGYCSLREDRLECTPPNAVAWPLYDELGDPDEFMRRGQERNSEYWWWFKQCVTTADCRESEGYVCNLGWGACTPKVPAWLVIGDPFELPQVCYEYFEEDPMNPGDDGDDFEDEFK